MDLLSEIEKVNAIKMLHNITIKKYSLQNNIN